MTALDVNRAESSRRQKYSREFRYRVVDVGRKRNRSGKRRWRLVALLALLVAAAVAYLESPWSTPPGWWRAHRHWPYASGPVRWRIVGPWLKATGRMPEMSWGELWGYVGDISGESETSGFVRRRETGEEPCTTLWQTPLGEIWGRATDEDLLEFLVIEELIDRIYDDENAGVREGDTVIDVGAHLGVFTRFALEHGAGRVVAFEPEATNLACLDKTFADEIEADRVVVVAAAAWHSRTTLKFKEPKATNTGEGRVSDVAELAGYDVVEVPAVTIDEVVDELGLERVDFIKMDIEGAERHALAGAKGTLDRFGPRMALCVYHKEDDREVLAKIALEARPSYRVGGNRQHLFFF